MQTSLFSILVKVLALGCILQIATALPDGFQIQEKMRQKKLIPIQLLWIDHERALLLHRGGTIYICQPNVNGFPKEKWIDLPNVYDTDETGAMAIQKDPEWTNGQPYIYVYYGSTKDGGRMRMSRFTSSNNNGGLTSRGVGYSEKVLWKDSDGWGGSPQWHYGGSIEFGPDKKIYLTLGDKYTDWMLKSNKHYAGCIVRVNKDGSIPSGNLPSNVKPNGCWAHGLRNGYSSYWDVQTNRYLVAEVGGNEKKRSWEDVHLATAGAHLGWPYCEGKCGNSDFPQCNCAKHDQPIFTYAHNPKGNGGQNACIIGGPVLRNNKWPDKYNGVYWHADFSHGTMSYLTFESNNNKKVRKNTQFDDDMKGIISMTKDYEGNLWITKWSGYNTGVVEKITYSNAVNTPPVVEGVITNVLSGASPLVVEFASDAEDSDGDTLTYQWIFGDGFESTSPTPTHVYTEPGEYVAKLFISDGKAQATSESVFIIVGEPPEVTLVYPINDSTFRAGQIVSTAGYGQIFNSETNAMEYLPSSQLSWEIGFIHDGHMHPLGSSNMTGSSVNFTFPHSGHSYEGNVGVQFSLTAVTSDGLTVTQTARMWPEMVTQRIETSPPGLTFQVDHKYYVTPFDLYTTPGFNHDIEITHGCVNGIRFDLKSVTGIYDPTAGTAGTIEVASDNSTVLFEYHEPDGRTCQKQTLASLPVVHFDAGLGVTQNASTGAISFWADVSDTTNAAVLAPSQGTAIFDDTDEDHPHVHLPGPNTMLASVNPTSVYPTESSGRTVSAVVRYTLEESAVLGFSWGSLCVGDDATRNQFRMGASSKTGGIEASLSCDTKPVVTNSLFGSTVRNGKQHATKGAAGDGWFVQTVMLSDSGKLSHFVNGDLVASDTLSSISTALQVVTLGVASSDMESSAAMDVKELLVFDYAAEHDERATIEQYLFEKHLETLYSSQAHVDAPLGQDTHDVCSLTDDDDVATLVCQDGYGIKSLSFVGYGIVDGHTCAAATMGSCTVNSAFSVVGQECVGKTQCSFPVTPAHFGEDQPCFRVPTGGVPLFVYQADGYQYKNMEESLTAASTQCPEPSHNYIKVGQRSCTQGGNEMSGWTDMSKLVNQHMGCYELCSADPDCKSYNYHTKTKFCTYYTEKADGIGSGRNNRCYVKEYTADDNRGEPIEIIFSSDVDTCNRACNRHSNCRFVTLSPGGVCHLYPGVANEDGVGFKSVYTKSQSGSRCMRREDLEMAKNSLLIRAVCARLELAPFQTSMATSTSTRTTTSTSTTTSPAKCKYLPIDNCKVTYSNPPGPLLVKRNEGSVASFECNPGYSLTSSGNLTCSDGSWDREPPTCALTPTPALTAVPTAAPTAVPTLAPTSEPTLAPTASPTATPTAVPTLAPTSEPTLAPTASPTATPTAVPTL
eukprot:gene11884-4868_t